MDSIMLLLDEIEGYLQECGSLPFSSKVMVDMEVLYEFMADLRMKLPEEVKRSKRIIDERDKMIETANQTASAIIDEAKAHAAKLIDEHAIRQQAIKEAEELMHKARATAEEITNGSYEYVDNLLAQNQEVLKDILMKSNQQFEQYNQYLRSQLDVLEQNRNNIKSE